MEAPKRPVVSASGPSGSSPAPSADLVDLPAKEVSTLPSVSDCINSKIFDSELPVMVLPFSILVGSSSSTVSPSENISPVVVPPCGGSSNKSSAVVTLPHRSLVVEGSSSLESPTVSPPKLAKLIQQSALLEGIGTLTTHVSGAPFVLIPEENIEEAKVEFKEFIFARFRGDIPPKERIIGVVNAIWARSGPRIFIHKVGEGCFVLKVTSAKTR
ncbi:hypothetical protein Rs2_04783 [Raphanus sativus]|nr:hypothetical protein Rs2_04783 [Raphanus sativus]